MTPGSHYYASLFNRLLEGELSPQDAERLTAWLGSDEMDPAAAQLILEQLEQPVNDDQISAAVKMAMDARLPAVFGETQSREQHRIPLFRKRWLQYAAAIIILAGIGIALLFLKQSSTQKTATGSQAAQQLEIIPGKDGAILTLADGSTVVLDSLGNGIIATQNGTRLMLNNGQLAYNTSGVSNSAATYNTVTTPKGRQFRLLLQDGTKVWLNAASSVRYPTVFTGKERKVEVMGEVYFEVARNEKKPFHVKVNDETEIEVLGTHFNINSYQNEATVNTTLLEGVVRVTSKGEKVVLKPGQQARVAGLSMQSQGIKILNDVDIEKVMAWKNGMFNFQDATLEEVMRQLERWYDIEVTYEKGIPDLEFIGKMSRDLSLSEVLRGLEVSKVHFRMEAGRKVVVMP